MRRFRCLIRLALALLCIAFLSVQAQAAPAKPVTERQLLAWIAAEIPTFNLQAELRARGVNFAPDRAWRESLKQAGVNPALLRILAKLPAPAAAASPDELSPRLVSVIREVNTKKYSAAAMHLAGLAKANRADSDLFLALGWTIGKQDNWGEAIPALLEATRLDPDSGFAHELLSFAAYRIGDAHLAVKEGKVAVELRPGDPDAYKFLGLAYNLRRDFDRSTTAYEQALRLKPDYAMVFYDIGIELSDQGRFREAVEAYQKAIALDGTQWFFYSNMGNVLADLRRWDEAIAAERRAKDLAPNELTVRQNLGAAYCNSGRSQEAVDEFQQLLAMDPNWNMARLCLYKSLMKLGRTEEAKQIKTDYDKIENGEVDASSSR